MPARRGHDGVNPVAKNLAVDEISPVNGSVLRGQRGTTVPLTEPYLLSLWLTACGYKSVFDVFFILKK